MSRQEGTAQSSQAPINPRVLVANSDAHATPDLPQRAVNPRIQEQPQQAQQQQQQEGGEDSFIPVKWDVSPEEAVAYTQGRSDDPTFPDLRTVRYDPVTRIIGSVESGHPAHEAVHMSIVEQITLQMAGVPANARLVPLGSPSTSKSYFFDSIPFMLC